MQGQSRIGRGQPQSQSGEDGKGDRSGRAERVADGRTHKRRGAGRGHHYGQHTGEKAARVAVLMSKRTAGAGQRQPDLKLPGQRQPQKKEQPGHQRQKDGRLELESPAQRGARRAQPQQHTHERPEGDQNARRIDQSMGPELAQLLVAGVNQRQPLQEEHRKDAGHQVQQQASEESEA